MVITSKLENWTIYSGHENLQTTIEVCNSGYLFFRNDEHLRFVSERHFEKSAPVMIITCA